MLLTGAGETNPQVSNLFTVIGIHIQSDDIFRFEFPGRFFHDFPPDRIHQGFVFFQMSRGLINDDTPVGIFFYDEKTAMLFADAKAALEQIAAAVKAL